MEYPKRGQFFAHKFVRLLHKAAVAADVGRDAFALLTVIAHTEDAMRYRGAAKFWNSQLIETLGFKKWDQFDACRKRAIESGWLAYECHGKRMAGEYFVQIPETYQQVDDNPIEESSPANGYDVGYKAGYDVGYEQGVKVGMNRGQSGVQTGDEQGEPSIPIPYPEPKPKNKTQEFIFPSDLDTPEFRAAWTDWKQFRKDIKHGLTAKTIEAQMNKFAKWGVTKSIAAIRKSIENGWQGLFEPTEGPAAVNGSASIEDDWDEVKAIVLEKYHPDVRCTKRIEQILTPEQFKAVIEVSPRKIWDSDRFDKVIPAAYRRARKGQSS